MTSRAILVLGLLLLGHLIGSFEQIDKMGELQITKRASIDFSPNVDQSIILFLAPQSETADPLWNLGKELSKKLLSSGCSYSNCQITSNSSLAEQANLVVFHGPYSSQCCLRNGDTVTCGRGNISARTRFTIPKVTPARAFMYFQREAPARTMGACLEPLDDIVNYTWSYRSDSDVFFPYGRAVSLRRDSIAPDSYPRNSYARNVLWYVSNCRGTVHARSRYEYALALSRYIDVDIYGRCTGRSDGCEPSNVSCLHYHRSAFRFYLAFENSHCDEYVTEKFFDALKHGNVPIVRGLPKHKYQAVAPPNSFIHADDFDSPANLSRYLRWLAASHERYAKYHEWRHAFRLQSGAPIACRLCELATLRPPKTVRVSEWWSVEQNCMA